MKFAAHCKSKFAIFVCSNNNAIAKDVRSFFADKQQRLSNEKSFVFAIFFISWRVEITSLVIFLIKALLNNLFFVAVENYYYGLSHEIKTRKILYHNFMEIYRRHLDG